MMPPDARKDAWVGADAYEQFMGRWSRALARRFVRWLGVPPGRHWLEVGCGTGALTAQICALGQPASVLATEPAEAFIARARAALSDQPVRFVTATAADLPARPGGYDAVVSCLVLNFLPDPVAALRHMNALTAEGGVVAACVWDYAGEMAFLRVFWDAAVERDPAARRYDEGARFPICSPPALEAAFREAGFSEVDVDALVVATPFQDFDDFWRPFLGGAGPAPGYLATLPPQEQADLARRIAARVPRQSDGSIALQARAWATRALHTPAP